LLQQHREAPHLRLAQKTLASDITQRVHGTEELENALLATDILFGKATAEALGTLKEEVFLQVFEGVPQAQISKDLLQTGISIIDVLVAEGKFLSSNSEARRELKANAITINKVKVDEQFILTSDHLLNERYALIGKGKKNNFIAVFN
jgi:tyrosyl-tRNA synthetase